MLPASLKVLSRNFGAVLLKKPKNVRDSAPLRIGRLSLHFSVFKLLLLGNEKAKPSSDELNAYLFNSSKNLQDSLSDSPTIKATGANYTSVHFPLGKEKVVIS